MNKKRWLIALLLAVSTISALFDGLYYRSGSLAAPATEDLAGVLLIFLIALWIDADSKDRPQIVCPFDYGFLVLWFWLPYLPYYLWRTRGTRGLLIFAGFLGLFAMGFLVQLTMYFLYRL